MKRKPLRERFDDRCEPCPTTGCWLWLGALNADGYGHIRIAGYDTLAHRAAWLIFRGAIPPNQCVLHHCDLPCCVNPGHLFIGSMKDNTKDMIAKNRGRWALGEQHGSARLTRDKVLEIIKSLESNYRLARRFGVNPGTIQKIKKGLIWKHVYKEIRA